MRRIISMLMLVTAAIAAFTPSAIAQAAPPQIVEVKLRDGSLLFGTIVSDERDRLIVKTHLGRGSDGPSGPGEIH